MVAREGDVIVEEVVGRGELSVDRGIDLGRHEIEAEDLGVRVRDRSARGAALVDDRGGEGEAGVEVRAHAVARAR